MQKGRAILIWVLLCLVILVPMVLAALSPLLQWREPIYILAGFTGIFGLCLLLVQPLLAAAYLPGLSSSQSKKLHRVSGALFFVSVLVHVVGLWITSPPDVVDVLMLRSPTPFSVWGLAAMWAVLLTLLLVVFRRRMKIGPKHWRLIHTILVAIIVFGTVTHALLIEGTMELISKVVISSFIVLVFGGVVIQLLRERSRP